MDCQTLKAQLHTLLKKIKTQDDGSPITNLKINTNQAAEIEKLTVDLENLNPHPQPIQNAVNLLNGAWQLQYSTAREIRALDSLPLGLQIGKVYQVINVADKKFFNLAQVKHPLKIISGYVKVTAIFEPDLDTSGLPDKRINVYFDKRFLAIDKIIGVNTPQLNPFKVVDAKGPKGRIPTLDITYLDETLRIGRGGDESLFILKKADDLPNLSF
ncbi:PAP/fibrillin family protein [Okeanomitos corallinicola TIOX110]|uniref:PAP/fibrillin family protein n=1 Tax=Okeanomitos corallinicola TIOX110 TaxID=3133117 RepID=A0ABZ2UWF4_9CYAN